MSSNLRNFIKYTVLFSFLIGCNSLYAIGPKISFGGYKFELAESPNFIGANVADALVLTFDAQSKATFALNNYSDYATDSTSLPLFLESIYDDRKPLNEQTANIKQELSKGRVSSKVIKNDNLTIYLVTYKKKEQIIIYDERRKDSWVVIECSDMDTSSLISSIQIM